MSVRELASLVWPRGGSRFGYALLSVVPLSSLMAMALQARSARLGLATDLAEVLGGTIALDLFSASP